ncbi:vesicle transport through interaction with t-SNAREs homolog 1A isoform X6 [Tympanuchus pallidicinctus]|uniref:vesicle transport through interaction with t-SNAREs homolog 1A isoform X6 n=1 Tax=Tympanuchus pallidicinctus TaxID=109042 RepID=UPI002286E2A4|nr:vesicle transport through interaction with t-SNAREs homolog 1A isoform X6 [Tympanuchus pallidicinctus]
MAPSAPRRPAGRNGKGKGRRWGPPGLGPAPRGGWERGRPPSAAREAEAVRALLRPAGKRAAEGRAVCRNPRRWDGFAGSRTRKRLRGERRSAASPPGRPCGEAKRGEAMSSDFESYEQDFAVLTADITGRIGRVPKLLGDEKKQMVANIEKQLEEARELLEQMELEVREIPPQSRGMYSSRMRSYKQEMGKLEADFETKTCPLPQTVRKEFRFSKNENVGALHSWTSLQK